MTAEEVAVMLLRIGGIIGTVGLVIGIVAGVL